MDLATARQVLSDIFIENCSADIFVKNKKVDVIQVGIKEDDYVSMQELQDTFGISRYHLVKYLKDIGASPLGERKNYIDGKRTRGVGKVVYPRSVLSEVKDFLSEQSDVESIKQMARKILEG
jgi:transcriptional antiterminator